MVKPLKEFIFRPMPNVWMDAGTCRILADVLAEYEIIVDDRTQFARIYDYERNILFYYRASAGKVQLTLWDIKEK